jgi:hypothetical protein
MPRFRVTFRKVVYDNTGHARAICQRIVEVEERDSAAAQATAMQRFCDLENVTNWLNHADWMEVARDNRMVARSSVRESRARHAA